MKSKYLKYLNPVLFLAILIQLITISIFKMQDFGWVSAPSWISDVHDINGTVFAGLAIAHIILNWGWIKSTILGIKPKAK
ncbi:MAG: hypothetical protein HPY53_02590 [Brevinematales bacterium]|nr:hypothetical protein [Brevinematales bacterium]